MPEFTAQDAIDGIWAAKTDYERGLITAQDFLSGVAEEIHRWEVSEAQTLGGLESTGERAARHRSELAGADLPPFPGYSDRQRYIAKKSTVTGAWIVLDTKSGASMGRFDTPGAAYLRSQELNR